MKDNARLRLGSRIPGGGHLRRALSRRQKPLPRGADVALLVDGVQFLPAIEQSIRSAKQQILIETYLITSDATGKRFVDLLCERAMAGVSVWLVFDAVGSIGLSTEDRNRLMASGAHLKMFNPIRLLRPLKTMFRTHRRIVVIDAEVGYLGGFGFTDEWVVQGFHGGPWHELAWQVRGAPVRQMVDAFVKSWGRGGPQRLPAPESVGGRPYWIMNKNHFRGGWFHHTLLRLIRRSEQRIWICTGYFVPSLRLSAALRQAAKRGVDVRLMLPGPKTDHPSAFYAGRRHYYPLLRAGVRIYESHDRMMHAKAAIFDDQLAMIGSSNLDHWSLRYNKEYNLAVVSREATAELVRAMRGIQQASRRIRRRAWERRPLKTRLLERLFGIVDPLL